MPRTEAFTLEAPRRKDGETVATLTVTGWIEKVDGGSECFLEIRGGKVTTFVCETPSLLSKLHDDGGRWFTVKDLFQKSICTTRLAYDDFMAQWGALLKEWERRRRGEFARGKANAKQAMNELPFEEIAKDVNTHAPPPCRHNWTLVDGVISCRKCPEVLKR